MALDKPAAVLALVVMLAACGDAAAGWGPPPTATIVDWDDPAKIVEFDGGWTVQACEGDGPFLCVGRNGAFVGSVEAVSYPVASFPHLDPTADGPSFLEGLAEGYLKSLRADRLAGCGSDYRFDPIPPYSFVLGGAPGLAYGFTGTLVDGRPSELNLQYSTVQGDRVVSIVAAAYDEGGCPGPDGLASFDSSSLAAFQPMLESVLLASPLPDLN